MAYASVLIAGVTIGVFFFALAQDRSQSEAQTWAVTMLALGQSAYLLNSRYLRESSLRRELLHTNKVVWLSISAMLLLQVMFVYVPFMNAGFNPRPSVWPAGWCRSALRGDLLPHRGRQVGAAPRSYGGDARRGGGLVAQAARRCRAAAALVRSASGPGGGAHRSCPWRSGPARGTIPAPLIRKDLPCACADCSPSC